MTQSAEANPPLFVVYLSQEWAEYHRRPHWQAIARLAPVLAVEPPAALLTSVIQPERMKARFRDKGAPRRTDDGVWLMRPVSLGSFGVAIRAPMIGSMDGLLMGGQIRRAIREIPAAFSGVVNVLVMPHHAAMARQLGEDLTVYEVIDEYRVFPDQSAFDPNDRRAGLAIRAESDLLTKVDLVVASSQALCDSRRQQHANVQYLPNAADFALFNRACDPDLSLPDDVGKLPSPRLGYVGGVNELIDLPLLEQVATSHPDWSIVLIGQVRGTSAFQTGKALRRLGSLPNVHLLGHRPYESLPAYVKAVDVCLMPFVLNPWMTASSPNKTFQYLAAGKPVVSTDFPEARRVGSVVHVAENSDRFVALCEQALSERSPEKMKARIEAARENSTDQRAERFLSIVQESLTRKTSSGRG